MKRVALVLAIAVAFFAGLTVDHVASAAAKKPVPTYRAMDVLGKVLENIENNYVEPVDRQDLVYGAIDGMVARLDPHSAFYRPEAYRQIQDEMIGVYEGVGLEPTIEGGLLTVIAPLADSPAEHAGIRCGDRVLSIDGASTRDMPLTEAVRRLRGKAGTAVALEIMREGFSAPQQLTLVRDRVRAQSVESRVLDPQHRYLYVRVKSFQEGGGIATEASLLRALSQGRTSLGGEIRGLVLDLRNNPGGLVRQAVAVADTFLPEGTIMTTEGRAGRNVQVDRATRENTEPDYPIIVLVNRGTASAAEIVAGALQDNERAVIMGTQTFGKGSVQDVIPLDDGAGLKLTVARYYTPHHRSIQEQGITPDVVVAELAPQARIDGQPVERDLKNHLRNDTQSPPVASPAAVVEGDYPLRTAVDYLKAHDILRASQQQQRAKGTTSRRD
jgi:carboxyl-terminal processing protease